MTKNRWVIYLSCIVFLLGSIFMSCSKANKIVEENIMAAGGKENLSRVKNFSFKYGSTTYYISDGGLMKLTQGREPIITEAILVNQDDVRRNCFNKITELTGRQKFAYQCLAKLRSGLFTLAQFKGQLAFKGLRKFGPKEHYLLATKVGDLDVEFYLDPEEYTIKRLVLKGFDTAEGQYEVNHDFGPYQEINGMKIPASWFDSQVGARGRLFEIKDVKLNQNLEEDFFSKYEVNVGNVEIGKAALGGNVIQSSFRRNVLTISTNWTDDCIQKAGFKAKDRLILEIDGKDIAVDFYESQPPRDAISPGANFMVPNPRSENYIIYLISPKDKDLVEKIEPLLPIRVKKSI
ncbi:MAG: hypothetical protein JSV96_06465 [Candidatus Aminicenantes bacterium]|nr:MAG: hypothetical protein JSV96_06465 [Candidatus Aminicenantes bacterium]